jgi:hypothetical protein
MLAILLPTGLLAQGRLIDRERSSITVKAFKSGLFSAFAHNHLVKAPIALGEVRLGPNPGVELSIQSGQLVALDPDLAADKRAEVQRRMLGPEVLDSERYPEIRFRSTQVQPLSGDRWRVEGELTLHGQTRPVSLEVSGDGAHYSGRTRIRQRDFGIEPVSVAGGTVKVKNELLIEFDVYLANASTGQ